MSYSYCKFRGGESRFSSTGIGAGEMVAFLAQPQDSQTAEETNVVKIEKDIVRRMRFLYKRDTQLFHTQKNNNSLSSMLSTTRVNFRLSFSEMDSFSIRCFMRDAVSASTSKLRLVDAEF